MTKRTKIGIVILGLIAAIIALAIMFAPKSAAELRTATVERGDVTQSIDVVGTVRKPQTLELAFLASGRIAEVNVEVGEYVEEGEMLAALEKVTTTSFTGEASTSQEKIESPIYGLVTAVIAEEGEVAMAGVPMIVIETAIDAFVIEVQIPESDVTKLASKKYDAVIALDAFGDDVRFVGELVQVYPAAATTQGATFYTARVTLDGRMGDGKGGLSDVRSGMSADVSIATSQATNALHIPYRAVIDRDGKKFVRVVTSAEEGLYEEREITTGLRGDNGEIVVRSGLNEGDVVVIEVKE